ncbi:nucleotide-binding protein [Pseudomonas syringae]|uniref:nucleotide-binding protein n=1 Tax=Pseudomonas syringae TaxID=317 RepID=UPI002FD8F232|nr:nucleotide-binding protein [Pseudomonas syringae]
MARAKPPAVTNALKLQLPPQAIERGITRLDECIIELEAFDIKSLAKGSCPELKALEVSIQGTLVRYFGENTSAYKLYSGATGLGHFPMVWAIGGGHAPPVDYVTPVRRNISEAVALLKQAQRALKEDLAEHEQSIEIGSSAKKAVVVPSNRIFVVHGHDEAALQGLARFLEKLGLEAIILKEQPDQGRTIIEKFEETADDIGFAVVLLTPDDLGASVKAETPDARARQNVIFELGYFAAKLGRGRVCLLRKGHVEIPSDLYGVIYSDMDPADGWKAKLVGELKAAKLDFDANRFWQ